MDLCAPKGREEEAIGIFYRNLIQYVLTNIKARFENTANMPQFNEAVPIVCSGGIGAAEELHDGVPRGVQENAVPDPAVSTISLASEPLNSVAKGCLVAAALGDGA